MLQGSFLYYDTVAEARNGHLAGKGAIIAGVPYFDIESTESDDGDTYLDYGVTGRRLKKVAAESLSTTSGTLTVDAGWQFGGNNSIPWTRYGNVVVLNFFNIGCDGPNPGTIVTTLPAEITPTANREVVVREDGVAAAMREVQISSGGALARVNNLLDFEVLLGTVTYIL